MTILLLNPVQENRRRSQRILSGVLDYRCLVCEAQRYAEISGSCSHSRIRGTRRRTSSIECRWRELGTPPMIELAMVTELAQTAQQSIATYQSEHGPDSWFESAMGSDSNLKGKTVPARPRAARGQRQEARLQGSCLQIGLQLSTARLRYERFLDDFRGASDTLILGRYARRQQR